MHVWDARSGARLRAFEPQELSLPLLAAPAAADGGGAGAFVADAGGGGSGGSGGTADGGGALLGGAADECAWAAPGGGFAAALAFAERSAPHGHHHGHGRHHHHHYHQQLAASAASTFRERGCSGDRGWPARAARAPPRAAAAPGAAPAAAAAPPARAGAADAMLTAPSAAGVGASLTGVPFGYTCIAPAGDGDGGGGAARLLAGTADARLCCLDLETGRLVGDDFVLPGYGSHLFGAAAAGAAGDGAAPGATAPAAAAAAAGGGGDPLRGVVKAAAAWPAAGLAVAGANGGWLSLVDFRAGGAAGAGVVAGWQAHAGAVTCVAPADGGAGGGGPPLLVTASHDRALRVWDLRAATSGGSGSFGGGACQHPGPSGWRPLRELFSHDIAAPHPDWGDGGGGGGGVALSALCGGALASGRPLQPAATWRCRPGGSGGSGSGGASGGGGGVDGFAVCRGAVVCHSRGLLGLATLPQLAAGAGGTTVAPMQWTAIRGRRGGGGGREAVGDIVGAALLPVSRLLVVGSEDGCLRICR